VDGVIYNKGIRIRTKNF